MFLSDSDIKRLTGLARKSAQSRWLLQHGFPHEVSNLGIPIVLKSVVEERLGVSHPKKREPNFAALHSSCIFGGKEDDIDSDQ